MGKDFNSVDFIKQILKESNPDIDTRPSTAFYDLFLKPMAYMLQPILDDATNLAQSQSVKNIEDMTEEEADALIANFTITRRVGGKASGTVRFYFSDLVDVQIPEGTVVLSSSGLRYLTVGDTIVSKESLSLNLSGGYYYVDSSVEAEDYGSEYNILPEEIVSTESTVENVVRVSNLNNITGGSAHESNAQLYNRALDAIATKNLLSKRSINTLLYENFPTIKSILTIGMNDPEMMRDIVTTEVDGSVYEVHIGGCADIYTNTGVSGLTDATADSTALAVVPASYYRKISTTGSANSTTVFTDSSGDFIAHAIKPGNILKIKTGPGIGDYEISSVDSATQITVDSAIPFSDSNIGYEIVDSDSTWRAPIIQMVQVDRLDPGTHTATGVLLHDGREVLVGPKEITIGQDPEIIGDTSDAIHCAFEYSDDIWYTKLTNAGLVDISSTNISSSSRGAYNPSIDIDSSNNIVIVWQSDDATANKNDIMLMALTQDGTTIYGPSVVISDSNLSYSNPKISCNTNGINIVSLRGDSTLSYHLIDQSDYHSILTNSYINSSLSSQDIDIATDNVYTYAAAEVSSAISIFKITSTGVNLFSGISFSDGTSNHSPSIALDSTSDLYICWDNDTSSLPLAKIDELGNVIYDSTVIADFDSGYSKSPKIFVDDSDKLHICVINENRNSGDVNYLKIDSDLSVLVDKDLIQDQYNNANYIALYVDSNRRPHVIWDSYDNRQSNIYYTKRQSQDYRIISLDSNMRYSMKEIINIKIDPEYSSDYLRFTYKYESNISDIDAYVRGTSSLDRVVVANYLVRYPTPVFVDIELEYSGNDSSAQDIISDYINDNTNTSISVSELVSILPSSVVERVTLPFYIETERHNQDGSITIKRSNNLIEEPRISKFIARNITVT